MSADFYTVVAVKKRDYTEIKLKFIINPPPKDLMIRSGDFYAAYIPELGMWSTEESSVCTMCDEDIVAFADAYSKAHPNEFVAPLYMWDSDSKAIDRFHYYVKNQMRDYFKPLNEKLIFSNQTAKRTDYVSKKLPYPFEKGDISAYEELIGTLYDESERRKLEWAIGAIISGDSKKIQKFEVLYGDKGTGKSTVLNIVEDLFEGFTAPFNAKAITSANNRFALECFKDDPLVSIQQDGDLSKIEDNTQLNSIVSHEKMDVDTKYGRIYTKKFNSFLFLGTNTPVKITDPKSGILRRLIDVRPTGIKVPRRRYDELVSQIQFEKGAIAYHCLEVYKELGKAYYDDYIPSEMMAETNDFYGFIEHIYDRLVKEDYITLNDAWSRYKDYCEFAGCKQMPYRTVRVELRNYFKDYDERKEIDGKPYRNVYSVFLATKFSKKEEVVNKANEIPDWLKLKETSSRFDKWFSESKAQYATSEGKPYRKWSTVKTKLSDLDTRKEHYVKPDEPTLICIDFDILGKDGKKDLTANLIAASKFPPTYAETSRSGSGLHLYYFYPEDHSKLSSIYDDYIEIKVFNGDASLRRRLSVCNECDIATIGCGLPLKEERKVINWNGYKNEQHLRNVLVKEIKANIGKEHKGNTAESINLIKKILDDAYESGLPYDVEELRQAVILFALNASNSKDRCLKVIEDMHFKSKEEMPNGAIDILDPSDIPYEERPIVFFDCEVYKNLFLIVWKYENSDSCTPMINPTPKEVAEFVDSFRLIGFNCRQYDNHILYARIRGYSNMELYNLSQQIIVSREGLNASAYNISWTDVFDFCTEKISLKKWEYRLGNVEHEEIDIPWDQPVPDDRIEDVVHYCSNDVKATEAVFNERQGDFMARKIQVDLVHLIHGDDIPVCVNDTTNTLSKRIIFGRNKNPQASFNYRDLSKPVGSDEYEAYVERFGADYKFRVFNSDGLPEYRDYIPGEKLPEGWSILPFFPGYDFDIRRGKDKSIYLNEVIGEGGRVYSVKGYYEWVWDGDISSQHPHSIISEVLFGPMYTKIFEEIVKARVAVKHKDFETAGKLLNGALKPYLKEEMAGDLAQALKIVINSIYGLTKAGFKNEFKDDRNIDNIVAKRGALFMTLLKREVERRGYMVCHIKTDSIKIPRADDNIKNFVISFGREYGYEFETEAEFAKFCLFNDAAYVGWDTVTNSWITKADQFKKEKQPYLYKTLFSHEPYDINDFCEVKSVSKGALYLDMNEDLGEPVDAQLEKERKKYLKMCEKSTGDIQTDPKLTEQLRIVRELEDEQPSHHSYVFVGRVGEFTPIKSGQGGGVLYRVESGRYYAAPGTTGYRWLQSSTVRKYGMNDAIDKSYYTDLVDAAKADINDMVDSEFFLSDELPEKKSGYISPDFMNLPDDGRDEIPWEEVKT